MKTKFTKPLAGAAAICHGAGMTGKGRYRQAGGAILAIAIIVGAVAGTIVGQSSIGLLVGTTTGILLAVLIWLSDRRKD